MLDHFTDTEVQQLTWYLADIKVASLETDDQALVIHKLHKLFRAECQRLALAPLPPERG